MLHQRSLVAITCAFLTVCSGELRSQNKDSSASLHTRVYVDGKLLPSGKVLVKDGVSYVEIAAFAEALGVSAQSNGNGYLVTTPPPKADCDHQGVEGQRFSEPFRADVAGVADEIESLRAVVLKKEKVPLGPRFDAIDRKLNLSTPHVQTDADMAVYYALSYANNSLAISYYKQSRGIPGDEAQKDQLDSMICSMESKFALMKGVLMSGGSCSVFKRMESQGVPKQVEATHPPVSDPQ